MAVVNILVCDVAQYRVLFFICLTTVVYYAHRCGVACATSVTCAR